MNYRANRKTGLWRPSEKPLFGSTIIENHPLAKGLIGRWLLNTSGGSIAYDLTKNKHDGSLRNMDASAWSLAQGYGLSFDGSTTWVDVADTALLSNLDNLTVSAWINIRNINAADESTVIGKWSQTANLREFLFELTPAGAISFSPASGATITGSILSENRWYHVAATYDLNTVSIYVDGSLDNSGVSARAIRDSDFRLSFGARLQVAVDQFFDGFIDDISLYNRVLGADEIFSLSREPYSMIEVPYRIWSDGAIIAPYPISIVPTAMIMMRGGK
jgi:hypothetical protein